MPEIKTYDHFNDPLKIIWRKGDQDDPYIPRSDSLPIINGIITLLEIPAKEQRVKISGMTEVNQDIYERRKSLQPNEFLVDYNVGIIQFHPSQEGKAFLCEYWGRGIILYPASRVYALVERSPDIVKTLQDIIDEAQKRLKDAEIAVDVLNQVIQNAVTATNNANTATDNANQAAYETLQAIQAALDAAASTIMIYKDPVPTFRDISTTYPNPENGWRVMVTETGDVYRYDGVGTGQWQLIANYTGGSIPFVSENTSGLLKSDDYKTFINRSILFVIPNMVYTGPQDFLVQFPYDGEILDVKGYCSRAEASGYTELMVQKISSQDFEDQGEWEDILNSEIAFTPFYNNGSNTTLKITRVAKGDYFRINAVQLDNGFKGYTIQINLKTK